MNLNLVLRVLKSFMGVQPAPDYAIKSSDSNEGNFGWLAPAIVCVLHPVAYFMVNPLQPILHFIRRRKQMSMFSGTGYGTQFHMHRENELEIKLDWSLYWRIPNQVVFTLQSTSLISLSKCLHIADLFWLSIVTNSKSWCLMWITHTHIFRCCHRDKDSDRSKMNLPWSGIIPPCANSQSFTLSATPWRASSFASGPPASKSNDLAAAPFCICHNPPNMTNSYFSIVAPPRNIGLFLLVDGFM